MKRRSEKITQGFLTGALALCLPFMGTADEGADMDFDLFGDEYAETDAVEQEPVSDPLMGFNRAMFKANDFLYLRLVEPVASAYGFVTPEGARIGVKRFFKNLGWPQRVVNNCLQGKFGDAGTETKRFVINSTVGVLGFWDPALNRYGIEPVAEDFGQTLAAYGIGAGPPVTLPFFGPSSLRDAMAKIPDHFLNPVSYLDPWGLRAGVRVAEVENATSLRVGEYGEMKEAALDPYTFFRDAYKQNRDQRIGE